MRKKETKFSDLSEYLIKWRFKKCADKQLAVDSIK